MQPSSHQQHPIQGRPPGAGECRFCGSGPAKKMTIQSMAGVIFAYQITRYKGWICRDCGMSLYRDQTASTLKSGWWSLTSLFVVPIFLLVNLIQWVRLTRLAAPQPTSGVTAPNPRPADPGRPLFRRPVALLLLFTLPFILVVLMIVALAIFA
jgi:hypothetical protein